MAQLPDLWDTCYEGEHRKLKSPEAFKKDFCDVCMNGGCRNSKGSRMSWAERISTQADRLLYNPKFSDPNDPNYRHYAEMDFEDKLRQALAIEVANQKGDWSPVTQDEVGRAAAQMVGILPPTGFHRETKLVDEVKTTGLDGQTKTPQAPAPTPEPPESEEAPPPVDEHGRRYLSDPSAHKIEVEDQVVYHMKPEGEWKIRGDSGKIYTVCLYENDHWTCTCPSREYPCKHARDIALKLSRAPKESPQPEVPQRPPTFPEHPENAPPTFVPKEGRLNTGTPNEGIMIGGAKPPDPAAPAQEADPWAPAPPKPKERILPVGGRVTFGSGKKKG